MEIDGIIEKLETMEKFYELVPTTEVLKRLKPYEIEKPEGEPPCSWAENTYNWDGRISHDLNMKQFKTGEGFFYTEVRVHYEGDIRGNYSAPFYINISMQAMMDELSQTKISLNLSDENVYITTSPIFEGYYDADDGTSVYDLDKHLENKGLIIIGEPFIE